MKKRSLLSLVLAVLSLFNGAPAFSNPPGEPVQPKPVVPEKHLYVATKEQVRAIETLFSYSLMANNPIIAEQELETKQRQARIKAISKKKSQDLSPGEQIVLMQDTFLLKNFDGFLAKTTVAIVLSLAVVALMEFASHGYCRANGLVEMLPGFEAKFFAAKELEKTELVTKKNDKMVANFFRGCASEFESYYYSQEIKSLLDVLWFMKPSAYDVGFNRKKSEKLRVFSEKHHTLGGSVIDEVFQGASNFTSLASIPKGAYVAEIFNKGERFPYLDKAMFGVKWIFIAAPFIKKAWQYISEQRAIGLHADSKRQLEDILAKFSGEFSARCRSQPYYDFLHNFFVRPLWRKHMGNIGKVYAELTQMGEKIRVLDGAVIASDKASLHRFVMDVHSIGIFGSAPGRATVVLKAFEHEFLKRMLYSAACGSAAAFAHIARCYARNLLPQDARKDMSNSAQVMLWASVAACSALSVKSCVMGLWNRDSRSARRDYQKFLKNLSLENSLHKSIFYWAWFLPMWRTSGRNIAKVEQLFSERASEIEMSRQNLHVMVSRDLVKS